jgi:hypothetical protein
MLPVQTPNSRKRSVHAIESRSDGQPQASDDGVRRYSSSYKLDRAGLIKIPPTSTRMEVEIKACGVIRYAACDYCNPNVKINCSQG